MGTIELQTMIRADLGTCFDLSRDLDLHLRSMAHTGEAAVAGRSSGLIGPDEEVTWRGRHFGLMHEHQSRITAFDRPHHFRDSMVRGRFRVFEHDHYFEEVGPGLTLMRDVLHFRSPLGPLGLLVDWAFMGSYLRRLLAARNEMVREAAEREEDKVRRQGGAG